MSGNQYSALWKWCRQICVIQMQQQWSNYDNIILIADTSPWWIVPTEGMQCCSQKLINSLLKSKQIPQVVSCESMTDLANHFCRWKWKQHASAVRMMRNNFKLFIRGGSWISSRIVNQIRSTYAACHSSLSWCTKVILPASFFVIPCANIQKEAVAKKKRQMAQHLIRFQHDNVAQR